MLVEPRKVLDVAPIRAEAEGQTYRHDTRCDMFDPAALGTTIIGLEAIRRERERDGSSRSDVRPKRARRRLGSARRLISAILRRTAEVIEPVPLPAR